MSRLASFGHRVHQTEQMDDFSIIDERLERALHEIRHVNRFLGGYRALRRILAPTLASWPDSSFTLLDLGGGLGDYAERIRIWARRHHDVDIRITSLDANAATAAYAHAYLDECLSGEDREAVDVVIGDALDLAYPDGAFHVVTANLFLHHFRDEQALTLLREMNRVASKGLVVNDLHRHVLAYVGIRTLAAVLPVSPMFRHDGPVSVRRAFTPSDLVDLARRAGLPHFTIRRHWAFRLTLSTLAGAQR